MGSSKNSKMLVQLLGVSSNAPYCTYISSLTRAIAMTLEQQRMNELVVTKLLDGD